MAQSTTTTILSLPNEILKQIVVRLVKEDSLCLGLAHTRLYNVHFTTHGKTGLFDGAYYDQKQNTWWGRECHVRIEDWLTERGFRVGCVTAWVQDETEPRPREQRVGKLVTQEEWERLEGEYLGKLGWSVKREKRSEKEVRHQSNENHSQLAPLQPRTEMEIRPQSSENHSQSAPLQEPRIVTGTPETPEMPKRVNRRRRSFSRFVFW